MGGDEGDDKLETLILYECSVSCFSVGNLYGALLDRVRRGKAFLSLCSCKRILIRVLNMVKTGQLLLGRNILSLYFVPIPEPGTLPSCSQVAVVGTPNTACFTL